MQHHKQRIVTDILTTAENLLNRYDVKRSYNGFLDIVILQEMIEQIC